MTEASEDAECITQSFPLHALAHDNAVPPPVPIHTEPVHAASTSAIGPARLAEAELLAPEDSVAHAEHALVKLEEARLALAAVRTVPKALEIGSLARALECYLQQCNASLELRNDATEIHLRASRRAGELLGDMAKNKGAATPSHDESASHPTLKQMGLNHNRSHRLQRLAAIPEPVFEMYIHKTRTSLLQLSANGLLRHGRPLDREQHRGMRAKAERGAAIRTAAWPQAVAQGDIANSIVTLVMGYVREALRDVPASVVKAGFAQAVGEITRQIEDVPEPLHERSEAP
jgi:hypothetical protein